jgi:arylsulfatase A-like enzyme
MFSHYDTFYDELIHVPLLFNTSDVGVKHDELVELLDLAPTLLDYANIPRPDGFLGSSLRSVFEADGWDKEGICVEAETGRAYRTRDWKYVRTDADTKLFNLTADPDEQNNVLDEHPDRAKEFEEQLERYEQYERETDRTVDAVEIDGQTKDRLEDLGYLR